MECLGLGRDGSLHSLPRRIQEEAFVTQQAEIPTPIIELLKSDVKN